MLPISNDGIWKLEALSVGTRPLARDWAVAGGVAHDRTIRAEQSHGNAR